VRVRLCASTFARLCLLHCFRCVHAHAYEILRLRLSSSRSFESSCTGVALVSIISTLVCARCILPRSPTRSLCSAYKGTPSTTPWPSRQICPSLLPPPLPPPRYIRTHLPPLPQRQKAMECTRNVQEAEVNGEREDALWPRLLRLRFLYRSIRCLQSCVRLTPSIWSDFAKLNNTKLHFAKLNYTAFFILPLALSDMLTSAFNTYMHARQTESSILSAPPPPSPPPSHLSLPSIPSFLSYTPISSGRAEGARRGAKAKVWHEPWHIHSIPLPADPQRTHRRTQWGGGGGGFEW